MGEEWQEGQGADGAAVFEDPFFGAWVRKEMPPGM